MQTNEILFIIGFIFLILGLIVFAVQLFGVFKFKYVLNRMHAAAMGDTLGLSLSMLGLMFMFGLSFTTLKLLLIVVFLWFSSPVSSHLIAALQVETDEHIDMHLEKKTLEEVEKEVEG